jgi:Ca-activated chloride channel family protein
MFAAQPVIKNAETTKQARDYISALRVSGGTNIHDSVVEALRQKPLDGMLPLVLFLTDGLPTIGQTSEKAIREAVAKGNPHQRRVFTFGVGVDVNTPLLSRIARETRASAEFVLPKEDVEVKVGRVFDRLCGPLLTRPDMRVLDDPNRVSDLIPSPLPDVFEGEQILLSGTYRGEAPLHFQLTGKSAKVSGSSTSPSISTKRAPRTPSSPACGPATRSPCSARRFVISAPMARRRTRPSW